MLLAVPFQKGNLGIWSLNQWIFADTIQLHISLKKSFLEVEDCCVCVKNTCFFEELSFLLFVCSALCACCSNCDFMEHRILFLQTRHFTILQFAVKESSVFTHRFNFYARDDAAGAITILTMQTST
jgi:hypothetical protein